MKQNNLLNKHKRLITRETLEGLNDYFYYSLNIMNIKLNKQSNKISSSRTVMKDYKLQKDIDKYMEMFKDLDD